MFQVMISQLQNDCGQLEQQVRNLSFAAEDLEKIISGVTLLSGMEEVGRQLRQQLSDMREEENVLRQLLQALNKILLNYINCEGRVMNELEADNYHYVPRDIGVFMIPGSNGLIR